MEKKAETLFKKYKTKYVAKLGRHALDNFEIDTLANTLFGTKYKGSFAVNDKFQLKAGYYIINNDVKSGAGIHWIAMVLTAKKAYIYDSVARDSNKLVSHLVKKLKLAKYTIINSDRKDKEQKETEIICGHLSISFLSVVKELGIKASIKYNKEIEMNYVLSKKSLK